MLQYYMLVRATETIAKKLRAIKQPYIKILANSLQANQTLLSMHPGIFLWLFPCWRDNVTGAQMIRKLINA